MTHWLLLLDLIPHELLFIVGSDNMKSEKVLINIHAKIKLDAVTVSTKLAL